MLPEEKPSGKRGHFFSSRSFFLSFGASRALLLLFFSR